MQRIVPILGFVTVLCVLGGAAKAIKVYDDGGLYQINIPIQEYIEIYDGPAAQPTTVELVAGGSVRDVDVYQHSIFLMSSGACNGSLALHDMSRGEISGGIVDEDPFSIVNSSQLFITGGEFGEGLWVRDEGQVFIHGSDFQIDGVPVPYGPIGVSTGLLEGTLENGHIRSNLNILDNGMVTLIPEPTSLTLLLIGTLLLPRKRNR